MKIGCIITAISVFLAGIATLFIRIGSDIQKARKYGTPEGNPRPYFLQR